MEEETLDNEKVFTENNIIEFISEWLKKQLHVECPKVAFEQNLDYCLVGHEKMSREEIMF